MRLTKYEVNLASRCKLHDIGFGFDVISTLEDFAESMDSVTRLDQCSISMNDLPDAQVVILFPRDVS